jgi:hypothetical protein
MSIPDKAKAAAERARDQARHGALVRENPMSAVRPAAFATVSTVLELRRSPGLCSGQRLQRQVSALVRDALDLPCRVAEQLVSKVGQGPRGRDLLPDLGNFPVIGVTARQAMASHANAVPGQPRLGPRLPVFLVE